MVSIQRRYVEWRINIREHDFEVIRYENGDAHRVGGAPGRAAAASIAAGDRLRVLNDPMAFEVRPLEYRVL